jgi:hypothetical protein
LPAHPDASGGARSSRSRASPAATRSTIAAVPSVESSSSTSTSTSTPTLASAAATARPMPAASFRAGNRIETAVPAGGSADGRVKHLAGEPDAFAAMVSAAGVDVVDPSTATAVAQLQVDAVRTFQRYAYRVERVDDIGWVPQPDAAEQAARRRLTRTYRSTIAPPAAREVPDGWRLTLWTVDDRALVEHTITVTRAGRVLDVTRTVEPRLPVPSSR